MEPEGTHRFDQDYWQQHWGAGRTAERDALPANPYLVTEVGPLEPGTALDAGCGEGAEAIWLAEQGWQVTAVDISAEALGVASRRATDRDLAARVDWVEADLTRWEPDGELDLVTTHYAHAAMPQLELYDRLAGWVRVGGTLLVVGHRHGHASAGHPPDEAAVTVAGITARLGDAWEVVTAAEHERVVEPAPGRRNVLNDVVVRATRLR